MTHHRFTAAVATILAGAIALVAGCAPTGRSASGSAAAAGSAGVSSGAAWALPVGAWQTTIDEADLRAAGITGEAELRENTGTFTQTMAADGSWTVAQVTTQPLRWPVFRGTSVATGPHAFRQTTTFPPDFAGDVVDFEWSLEGPNLRLGVPSPPDPIMRVITESHPWTPAR